MNAPAAEAGPKGLIGAYRSLWKALERVPIALPVLVMRIGVALVFWRSGQSKLPLGNESTITLFRDIYQVPLLPPELAAYLSTMVEISGAALLALGILTRPAAVVLLALTIVIQIFVFPENYPDHLLWAGPLLYLLLRGPGKWSFDAAIRDRVGGGR
jgi:putative oxidoreductase